MSSSSKNNAHMLAAGVYSNLSHAKRLKVGAVITKDDRIISIGYNGTPRGFDNECETKLDDSLIVTKPEVIHAEANAILFAAKTGIPTEGTTLFITHSPCFECAKMIIQSGIVAVYYREIYRDASPLKLLTEANVKYYQL